MLGAISVLTGQQPPAGGQHAVSTYSWWSQVSRAVSGLLLICFEITPFYLLCVHVCPSLCEEVRGQVVTLACLLSLCESGDKTQVVAFNSQQLYPSSQPSNSLCVCVCYVCTCGCKGTMPHMWRSEDSLGWWSFSRLVWGRVSTLHCCCVLHASWPESFQRSFCLHLPLPWGRAGTTGTTRRTNPVLHGLWVSELRSLILGPLPTKSFSQPCFLSFKIIML